MTVVVSIGRDRDGLGPMSTETWEEFKAELRGKVRLASRELLFWGEGIGQEPTFQMEDSYTVVASGFLDTELSIYLGNLAERYGQRSIAVTSGKTQFVSKEQGMVLVEPGGLGGDSYPGHAIRPAEAQ